MTPIGIAFVLYANPDTPVRNLWLLVPIIFWGVYMTLISVIVMHVNLDLPHTPVTVREAILDIGWGYIGMPLLFVALVIAFFGLAWWAVVSLVFVCVIVIFGTFAFWVRLVRTYRK
ncbi:hypothetical protein QOZ80_1BG0081390 [Eleusine coracana subsp. coracana]|nr:hypothetical protein QOZ80_1BG0081390 [Eleusine coracana subsp. coracana]